jgi:AbiJ N-terminal domain 4
LSRPDPRIDLVPIHDTFTKRKRRAAQAGQPEVYTYDFVPPELRAQVAYMWRDALGGYREVGRYDFAAEPPSNARWRAIRDLIARERGVFSLSGENHNAHEQCLHALLHGDADSALEVTEVSFQIIDTTMRRFDDYYRREHGLKQSPDEAISELNHRFREHGVGYRFEGGILVRLDSEFIHAEVTLPALALLHTQGFDGALQEFMHAHEHYRRGETKDANVDAMNALESALKTICDLRQWKYSGGATASDLIKVVLRHELIPAQLQGHFDSLVKAFETGLPPMRNSYGAHGQGAAVMTVEDHLAAYSIHLMAADIVLLIEAHNALPR